MASLGSVPVVTHPERAPLIGLASLERMGPVRLGWLLHGRSPADAWESVRCGRLIAEQRDRDPIDVSPSLAAAWQRQAASFDLDAARAAHDDAEVVVCTIDHPLLVAVFGDDPSPPPVLFVRGELGVLGGPAVAIVGTRDCTRYGIELANQWGRELASVGVSVVSGLAAGIDGAAHAGALAAVGAPPIGVVGSGLDVPYPRGHRKLWESVADYGVLLSEHPLGSRPKPWHFPARNRLIAALADLTVVVESHLVGGSMGTVDETVARSKDVLAVPGSVRSRASDGTNKLLFEGSGMARTSDDVLLRLGAVPRVAQRMGEIRAARDRRGDTGQRPEPSAPAAAVLDAVGWEPASMDQVLVRSGLPFAEAAGLLSELEAGGWVVESGGWFERTEPTP